MRPLSFFALLLAAPLALASAPATLPAPVPPAVSTLASNNTAFACDLYAQLKTNAGNLFFSPYSISSALAMTYAGARGNTATQMAQALHFTLPQAELHPVLAALGARMNAVQRAGKVRLHTANSLWPQKGYPLLDTYLALVRENYGTIVTPVDFLREEPRARAQINQWVEEKTQQKIMSMLGAPLDATTRLVLVNAVYFKGKWERQFRADETRNEYFYPASGKPTRTPTMSQTRAFRYGSGPRLQALELPYAGGELSMLVLLPAKGKTVTDIEAILSAERISQWRASMNRLEVQVFLPRWKATWGTQSLRSCLQSLGMRDAFDTARADFSGMDGQQHALCLSDVLHKAFVDVNEEGTEAAAATEVLVPFAAAEAPPPPPIFRADRPFLFLIQENATGSILFMGRVVDPMAE